MENGICSVAGRCSVDETVVRIQTLLRERGVKLFVLIDHSSEAKAAGLEMRSTKLLIFGSPRAGTPVMLSAPSTALDLPLKILVAEDAAGRTTISWNDPGWLQKRHGFDEGMIANLAAVEIIAKKAAE